MNGQMTPPSGAGRAATSRGRYHGRQADGLRLRARSA
jgi:hypothetical protein